MIDAVSAIDCFALCAQLLGKRSVTPDDQGCQAIIADSLKPFGFDVVHYPCEQTKNILLTRGHVVDETAPHLIFVGHTDVVPADEMRFMHPPFKLTHEPPFFYGRGIADMKGAIAAMVDACSQFVLAYPHHIGRISLLLTSDEEGSGIHGMPYLVDSISKTNPDFFDKALVLVGEPSSQTITGDVIKVGRRGSMHAQIKGQGKAGHIAYPDLLHNPIHEGLDVIKRLSHYDFKDGSDVFQPTSLQFYNLKANSAANNVTPDALMGQFNLRFSPLLGVEKIKQIIEDMLNQDAMQWTIDWQEPVTMPYYSKGNAQLRRHAVAAIKEITHKEPRFSTTGGTSDGRHLAPIAFEVLELGLPSSTIHQDNERVTEKDLIDLKRIYLNLLQRLFVV